jgi:hypothetical protein
LQAVARLPQLGELDIDTVGASEARIPFGLFAHLSTLSSRSSLRTDTDISFFSSQMAIAIANSPHLRSLSISYSSHHDHRPVLSELFAGLSSNNPLSLEHLYIKHMDATVDQVVLPHLKHLSLFQFFVRDTVIVRSVWTSFLVNNIKLSDVNVEDAITEETMSYLSSFSGLKRLILRPAVKMDENARRMFFAEVLPKHVGSLEMLSTSGYRTDNFVKQPYDTFVVLFSLTPIDRLSITIA